MWNIYERMCVWRTKKEHVKWPLHAANERRDQRAFSSGAVYWATTKKKIMWRILFNSEVVMLLLLRHGKKKSDAVKYTIFNFVSFWFITFLILHIQPSPLTFCCAQYYCFLIINNNFSYICALDSLKVQELTLPNCIAFNIIFISR